MGTEGSKLVQVSLLYLHAPLPQKAKKCLGVNIKWYNMPFANGSAIKWRKIVTMKIINNGISLACLILCFGSRSRTDFDKIQLEDKVAHGRLTPVQCSSILRTWTRQKSHSRDGWWQFAYNTTRQLTFCHVAKGNTKHWRNRTEFGVQKTWF
jgi:hypothetical protein